MPSTHRNRLVTAISNAPGAAGALTIASAAAGYRTFGAADNGLSFDVSIVDGTAWEIRTGCVYTHAGTSLSRGTLEDSSTGSAITLTSAAVLTVTMTATTGNNIETQLLGDIDGLEMVWVSGSAITINTGSAQMESSSNMVRVTTPIALTGVSIGSNAWGHVYVYSSGGTPAAEVSTTAPDAPYFATARSKTGDATRRYVGSIRTDGTATIRKFMNDPLSGLISYPLSAAADYRVLSAGTAIASTSVSLASFVPITSTFALIKASHTGPADAWIVSRGDDAADALAGVGYFAMSAGVRTTFPVPLSASQTVNYDWSSPPGSGGAFIDVLGYWYKR